MENQSPDRRFALLIDADNVSAKYLKPILDELSKYGTVTYKRIYGDWTLNLHAKWKEELLKNSITPIQQFGYTQGKNATDSAMIIDAMDILYANSVEGFCIVSSDSDFTRLAVRLRESGRMVIGMGEKKTPTPFRTACDVFTTLELLAPERSSRSRRGRRNKAEELEVVQEATATREQIEQAVVDIITDNINNDKATGLGEVGSRLLKRYPDFDVRSYGTGQISKLLESFASVVVRKEGYNVAVELAEGVEPGTILDFDADQDDSEIAVQAQEQAENAEGQEKSEPAADDTASSGRRRRRRGGRSRRKADAVEQAAEEEIQPEDEVAPSDEAVSVVEEAAAEEKPVEEKPKRTRRRSKKVEAVDQKTPQVDSVAEGQEEQTADKPAPKKTRTRRSAKKAESESVPEEVQQSVQQRGIDVSKVNAYLSSQIQSAGDEGVSVGELGKKVRGKFRGFKLRDMGFQNLRSYLATLGDVKVEKHEGDHRVYMRK